MLLEADCIPCILRMAVAALRQLPLDEEREHLQKKISFLLLSKCEPYYRHFGVEIHQPILANYY